VARVTGDWPEEFFRWMLRTGGNVQTSAELVGATARAAYKRRRTDAAFRARWEQVELEIRQRRGRSPRVVRLEVYAVALPRRTVREVEFTECACREARMVTP
jgi:hypothetical protein